MRPEKKKTFLLCIFLILLLIVVLFLVLAIGKTLMAVPAGQGGVSVELELQEGMALQEAKSILEAQGVRYTVVPTSSRMANTVERIEHTGTVENGKIILDSDSEVKFHANEVGKDKVVYLTFDDGPKINYTYSMEIYHTTGKLLDVLDQYGIKATFFIVGYQMIKSDRSVYVTDMLNRGHILASHTSTHELSEIYSSSSNFIADVEQFENELKDIIGAEKYNSLGKYIRFPGGSSTNGYLTKSEAEEYISAIRNKGYKVYDWTALTGDAEGKTTASEFIEYMDEGLEKSKKSGSPLIVLMHDTDDTTQALGQIIEHLIDQGYYFGTINSCPEYTFVED